MAGAGERHLAGRGEARPGHAEVGVRILGAYILSLSCTGRQQRDLVDDVLHLVGEWLRLQWYRRWRRRSIAEVHFGVCVPAEFYSRAESFAWTRAALQCWLNDAYDAARCLPAGVARPDLMRLKGRR